MALVRFLIGRVCVGAHRAGDDKRRPEVQSHNVVASGEAALAAHDKNQTAP